LEKRRGLTAPELPDEGFLENHRFAQPVFVTRPTMPNLDDYARKLEPVWESRWLTNEGQLQVELRDGLCESLGLEHLSLCCNGTVALLIALQAERVNGGEVITTPFTFAATVHALYWNRIRPVFCDIDPVTFNLDPRHIEGLITPETRAILPVHVFGYPCDIDAIEEIAVRHGLAVIYDAAHAMGVGYRGRSLLGYGDLSIASFHGTKLFSTGEGGAVVSSTEARKQRVDLLKNFGITGEESVIGPGMNGKMSEFQAAFGLLQLDGLADEISRRHALTDRYRDRLRDVPGLWFREDLADVQHNYSSFPVLIESDEFGLNRNQLCEYLKRFNVHARKYFYPLCSHFPTYSSLPSSNPEKLPVAERVADRVLCLPLYGTLGEESVDRICSIIRYAQGCG
jgi:dTDP-4-amino-4,6-dideoxygalactose transaminase